VTGLDAFTTHSLRTSLFFPASRLFVAGNPKAAGTSLRWWLLQCHGIDVAERTADSLWGESAFFQTVWDDRVDLRYAWDRLSTEEQKDALTSSDVLTVLPIRHPITRIFAAWASKFLSGEPYYEDALPEMFPRLPDVIGSIDNISSHFAEFAAALSSHVAREGWAEVDVHFWPQTALLSRVPVGPTLLLRQEDMAGGLAEIRVWLSDHGVLASERQRLNEAVVAYRPSFVAAALDCIVSLYPDDFDRYGYPASTPSAPELGVDLDWLNDVRGRNRRFGIVHEAAITAQHRSAFLESQLREVRQRVEDLEQSTSWRVTRPLRTLSDRLGHSRS